MNRGNVLSWMNEAQVSEKRLSTSNREALWMLETVYESGPWTRKVNDPRKYRFGGNFSGLNSSLSLSLSIIDRTQLCCTNRCSHDSEKIWGCGMELEFTEFRSSKAGKRRLREESFNPDHGEAKGGHSYNFHQKDRLNSQQYIGLCSANNMIKELFQYFAVFIAVLETEKDNLIAVVARLIVNAFNSWTRLAAEGRGYCCC